MGEGPTWKREIVPDHKFDFIDTREFQDNGFGMRMKYLWLYAIVLKSFLVYVSDIFTAVTMLTTDSWSNQIFNSCPSTQDNGCVFIPFTIGKWLFVGCIIFSFLLLAYEARKSKKIIASRDISYAFTNVMANHYYSLRSYDHFCFFSHISESTKKKDDFAFFIFFTFKSWKRLLLADGPRQVINALTLYAIYLAKKDDGNWYDIGKYFANNTFITTALTITTLFTVLVFGGSLLLLIVAGVCYIPLLCYIQGNLKEYCCHKVDKRIADIIKRRNKQRLAKATALAKKEAAGDYSHLKNKKGEMVAKPLPQPTLPNISLDDDFDDAASVMTRGTRGPAASNYNGSDYFYASETKSALDYPPMPAYNPYSHHQEPNGYAQYNPSVPNIAEEPGAYEDEYGSTAHLTTAAQPYGQASPGMHNPYSPGAGDYVADPYDVYSGNVQQGHTDQYHATHQQRPSDTSDGLAYDAQPMSDYGAQQQYGQQLYAQHQSPYGQRAPSPGYGQYPQRAPSPGQQAPAYDYGGGGGGNYGHAM